MVENREKKWNLFKMGDIFDIKDGYYNKKPPKNDNGNIPFLGATQNNNGITMFCEINDVLTQNKVGDRTPPISEGKIFNGGAIAITNNGSVGFAYYQPNPFTCSHDITPIYIHNHFISEFLALFLIPILEQAGKRYEYARKWRPIRMKSTRIILPVNSDGLPDWDYMESEGKRLYRDNQRRIMEYVQKRLKSLEVELEDKEYVSLEGIIWNSYELGNLFEIERGKRQKADDRKVGSLPYIGATKENNGITDFISNPLFVRNGAITTTIFGHSFWMDFSFTAGDDVSMFYSKSLNKYTGLFVSNMITTNIAKFGFNYKAFGGRLKRLKILLPQLNNEPDWEFMEQYMKQLELDKLKKVYDYLQQKTAD